MFDSNQANADILLTRGSDGRAFATDVGTTGSSSTLGGFGSQVVISIDTNRPDQSFDLTGDFTIGGGFGISSILHELQHALGVGHGGNYNNNVDSSTQQQSIYDTKLYTTMSYIAAFDTGAKYYSDYIYTDTSWDFNNNSNVARASHTWMSLDILALQRLYGEADDSFFSGGQTFGFNTTVSGVLQPYYDFTVNTTPVIALYSQGGGNTLDLSGFVGYASTVNLDDGAFSSAGGLTNNIAIAYGTSVYRVITGAEDDDITGNEGNNVFDPGGRDDTVRGLDGDDTMIGSAGLDNFDGGDGNDTVDHRASAQAIQIDLAAGTSTGGTAQGDTYTSVERVLGTSQGDTLTGRDDANETFFGYGGVDILDGATATTGLPGERAATSCAAARATIASTEGAPRRTSSGTARSTCTPGRSCSGRTATAPTCPLSKAGPTLRKRPTSSSRNRPASSRSTACTRSISSRTETVRSSRRC